MLISLVVVGGYRYGAMRYAYCALRWRGMLRQIGYAGLKKGADYLTAGNDKIDSDLMSERVSLIFKLAYQATDRQENLFIKVEPDKQLMPAQE